MIVRMKKMTMVVLNKEREDFLTKLRREGVVHIKSLARPTGQDITAIEEEISQAKKALSILSQVSEVTSPSEEGLTSLSAKEIVDRRDEIEELEKKIQDIKNSMQWYRPWGGFNPKDIVLLRERGINVRLYALTKSEFKKIQEEKNIYVVNKDSAHFYIVEWEKGLPFTEIKPPLESLSELEAGLNDCNKKIQDARDFLKRQAVHRDGLNNIVKRLGKRHRFLEVFYGMRHEDGFSLLQGFCPVDEAGKVIALAKRYNIGYLVEEPDDLSEVPTLIRNPRWLRIISPVFKFLNTLPGYSEFDISPVFLLFFSLFFAIIIGDAGYGILICLGTWFMRRKMNPVRGFASNGAKEPFFLMYVLGFSTIIWGAITGTWFGFEQLTHFPFFNALIIDRLSSFVSGNQDFMIFVCFTIGVIHLTIAHLMRFIRAINTIQSLSQLGWISILWGLYFLAGRLVLNKPFPDFAGYLIIIGASMVLLFAHFQRNILKGILLTLIDTPLAIAGSFGDIVSYLRLFAVGSASLAISTTFNSFAVEIGFSNILAGLFSVLILVFAHTLNIAMSFLSVIVHGIRLNMLEFSGHLGMQWSGSKYSPFSEE